MTSNVVGLPNPQQPAPALPGGAVLIPLYRRVGANRSATAKDVLVGHTIVDTQEHERLSHYVWRVTARGYVFRADAGRSVYMHREVLGLPRVSDGREADHINRNRLDNRRANLRIATRAQNCQNVGGRASSSSRYRGVSWSADKRQWQAHFTLEYRMRSLGYFHSEEEAALAASAARARFMPFSGDALLARQGRTEAEAA